MESAAVGVTDSANAKRPARQVSERDIAIALVLELAESGFHRFALMGFYDDDSDFLHGLANRLKIEWGKAFINKVTQVTRRLVRHGALHSEMRGTHKEYIGEPTKQMEYWLPAGKANLLTAGKTDCTMSPEGEAAFLIRRAYPNPDND